VQFREFSFSHVRAAQILHQRELPEHRKDALIRATFSMMATLLDQLNA